MNRRATQQCNMSPYVYAVYWLPPASSAFLLARKCNWLAEKMLITCVMRHARLQKLQRFRRKMPFYSFLILWYNVNFPFNPFRLLLELRMRITLLRMRTINLEKLFHNFDRNWPKNWIYTRSSRSPKRKKKSENFFLVKIIVSNVTLPFSYLIIF